MLRITEQEAKKLGIRNPSSRSLYKDNSKDEVYQRAIQTICNFQSIVPGMCLNGDIGFSIYIQGKTRADIDNVAKGCLDAAQGLIFKDDKQVKSLYIECENTGNR